MRFFVRTSRVVQREDWVFSRIQPCHQNLQIKYRNMFFYVARHTFSPAIFYSSLTYICRGYFSSCEICHIWYRRCKEKNVSWRHLLPALSMQTTPPHSVTSWLRLNLSTNQYENEEGTYLLNLPRRTL